MPMKVETPNIPEHIRTEMDTLLRESRDLAREAERMDRLHKAATTKLAMELAEVERPYKEKIRELRDKRDSLVKEITSLWDEHLSGWKSARFPVGIVMRQDMIDLKVSERWGNREWLHRKLCEMDLHELTGFTFDEKGLRKLYRRGKLKGCPVGTFALITIERLVIRPDRGQRGKIRWASEVHIEEPPTQGPDSGEGKSPAARGGGE